MSIQIPQSTVLRDINGMSERVRVLRRIDAVANSTQIKAAEGQLRTKWQELRALRAGTVSPQGGQREGSHLYRALAIEEVD
ncbi:MAG: hypothetical protein WEB52_03140 [Dehalococcoidia bacterium]